MHNKAYFHFLRTEMIVVISLHSKNFITAEIIPYNNKSGVDQPY